MSLVGTLLSCHLFQDLSAAEVEELARAATAREFQRGEYVWVSGDAATHLYVVQSGQLEQLVVTPDGQEKASAIWSEGGVLGHPGLFAADRRRIVDCVATAPSRLVAISRRALVDFLHRHPPAMERMLELLADELRASVLEGIDLAFVEIEGRVARKLLDLAATHGEHSDRGVILGVPLTQGDLARMIGASREQVNRAIGRLARAGHVRTEDGSVRLVDPEGLEAALSRAGPRIRRPGLRAPRSG